MEIKINQHESYKIDIPSVVDKTTFFGLLDKLNSVSKILSKADLFANPQISEDGEETTIPEKRIYVKSSTREWCNTREKVISILKIHYFGEKEKKLSKAKEFGETWENICKSFMGLKKRHAIQPKEVGLKRFPIFGEMNKTNFNINSLKI